ncbi:MAG: hypothetical protein R2797_05175 [Gelidibacter sp.]
MNPAEEYIFNQPEPYKSIMLHSQLLIEHTFPKMVMKYKWRIPCFYLDNRPICFLNQSKDYVDVAFCTLHTWSSTQSNWFLKIGRK